MPSSKCRMKVTRADTRLRACFRPSLCDSHSSNYRPESRGREHPSHILQAAWRVFTGLRYGPVRVLVLLLLLISAAFSSWFQCFPSLAQPPTPQVGKATHIVEGPDFVIGYAPRALRSSSVGRFVLQFVCLFVCFSSLCNKRGLRGEVAARIVVGFAWDATVQPYVSRACTNWAVLVVGAGLRGVQ